VVDVAAATCVNPGVGVMLGDVVISGFFGAAFCVNTINTVMIDTKIIPIPRTIFVTGDLIIVFSIFSLIIARHCEEPLIMRRGNPIY
jgi:hypothetical protein